MNLSDRIARLETRLSPSGHRVNFVMLDDGRQSEAEIEAVALAACRAKGGWAAADNTMVWARSIVAPSDVGPVRRDRPIEVVHVRCGGA